MHNPSRLFILLVSIASLAIVLAACTTDSDDDVAEAADDTVAEATDDAVAEEEDADDAIEEEAESEGSGPEFPLDIETLQVETPRGTLQAAELPNTFVGAVTDDLFVGISIPPEGSQYAEGSEIIVYVCNSQDIAAFLYGDLSSGEAVSDDGDVRATVEIGDDEITGSVEVNGEDAGSFTATPTDEESGVFYALVDGYLDDVSWQLVRVGPPHYTGGWIILNAQMQQGYWWDRDPDDDSNRW
jgi:hypothetical protein